MNEFSGNTVYVRVLVSKVLNPTPVVPLGNKQDRVGDGLTVGYTGRFREDIRWMDVCTNSRSVREIEGRRDLIPSVRTYETDRSVPSTIPIFSSVIPSLYLGMTSPFYLYSTRVNTVLGSSRTKLGRGTCVGVWYRGDHGCGRGRGLRGYHRLKSVCYKQILQSPSSSVDIPFLRSGGKVSSKSKFYLVSFRLDSRTERHKTQ